MKRSRRWAMITGTLVAIVLATGGFLFFTQMGLIWQGSLAAKADSALYWRLLAYRLAKTGYSAGATQVYEKLAFRDLDAAREAANVAIRTEPDYCEHYWARGRIEMMALRYTEARRDFEEGLRLRLKGQRIMGEPSVSYFSNAVAEATGCEAACVKAWGHSR